LKNRAIGYSSVHICEQERDLMEEIQAAVKSADRVLDLFELLAGWGQELSHTDIASALKIPKSSLTQLLRNLVGRGYLEFSPASKGYRLGEAFTKLTRRTSQIRTLAACAQPILEEVTQITMESSALNQLKGDQVEVVATVSSPLRLVSHMRLGDLAPLYAVSAGKSILAYMPDAMREEYFSRVVFERITPKTISSKSKLRREIANVRRQGVAYSLEEFTIGIVGVSVPILSEAEFPVGALNIAIPTVRFTPDARKRAVKVLTSATERIGRLHLLAPGSKRRASLRAQRGSRAR
jgi:DNA-binding IclR family transcriptional regulator